MLTLHGHVIAAYGIVWVYRHVHRHGTGKCQYSHSQRSRPRLRISQNIFDFWTTVVIACLAGVVGSIVSYWLGSYGGRPLLLKYGKYIFFNEKKFNMAETMFNKYGGAAVLICRCLPGVRTFISFPAGVARYPFGRFVVFTIIGTIPWTLLLVWAGSILGSHWKDLIQYNHIFLAVIVAICAVCALLFLWKRRRGRLAK